MKRKEAGRAAVNQMKNVAVTNTQQRYLSGGLISLEAPSNPAESPQVKVMSPYYITKIALSQSRYEFCSIIIQDPGKIQEGVDNRGIRVR
jgi:hypothetical protein